ncbi:DUF551 domain-containing protein [Escherichia coli]|uniref:DUF551 domain-containing protein n=1 Tax=Escherichia coli TaxID=562 RepID=UPI0028A2E3C8|nr:DUF551 domain-containing protein [Escherichia coli]MDT4505203.1 DUF551 domain-containing protein [Escherichia coli]
MTTISRERIEQYANDPRMCNVNNEIRQIARIALASLEAEPVVYMWDSERKDIDAPGYYRAEHLVFAESSVKQWGGRVVPLYTAPPAPVALAVLERLQSIVADPRALPRRKEWVSGQQYSYVLLENVEAMVDEACRAAMLHSAEPVSQTYKLNKLSGNPPVTPDGWIGCSERMPDDGQHVIILCDGAFVLYAQYRDGEFFDIVRNGEEFFETQSRNVTHWMPLPEPPKEVNRG